METSSDVNIAQVDYVLIKLKQASFDVKTVQCIDGWGSTPDPTGGTNDAPPDTLIVKGSASRPA